MAKAVKVDMWQASDESLHETKAKAEIHDAKKALSLIYNECISYRDEIVDFDEFVKILRNNETLIGVSLGIFKEHGVKNV
jgi:hypothetical protein